MGNSTTKNYSRNTSVSNSLRSARWDSIDLPAPPGKPILISGTNDAQPDVVAIRWERSPSNGRSAIIGYLVEHRRLGSPHWIRSTSGLCAFPELTLSGLEPGWRYQFRVRAQNGLGLSQPSEISEPLTVTLQRAIACPPRFDLELQDTVALENDKVEFVVQFSGTPLPKVSWFKDDFEIFSSRRTRIVTDNGKSNLLIHQTALNDEGEIKCTVTNKAGYISTKAKLILEAPARIRLPRQYEDGLLFERNETIRLKVALAGRPSPAIAWYHDGELIPRDGRHIFEMMDGESVLKISSAERNDRGEYTVKATNKLNEDVASFLVTVTDRPAAPGKVAVTMTLGRSVTLAWKESEDDGGCKIGTYIVEYYRIGWEVWLKATTSRSTTATLTELIEGSEYKFRVKAENPYGVSDPSEESDVVFIPDLKRRITTPLSSLNEKSQSHREISRSRSNKREVSFTVPAQRTRSLTREEAKARDDKEERYFEYNNRSTSSQRIATATCVMDKSSRNDKGVTFAFDNLEKVQPPIPPLRSKESTFTKQEISHKDSIERPNIAIGMKNKAIVSQRERTKSPELTKAVAVSSPVIEEDLKSSLLPMIRARSFSPVTMPTQESQIKDNHITVGHNASLFSNLYLRDKNVNEDIDMSLSSNSQAMPREDDENALHDSSEFILVLYPEDEAQNKNIIDITNDAEIRARKNIDNKEADEIENYNDLIPPPKSLSLPELFSAQHQVVEIIREAVSSTELLYERAMEHFYRAVAVEEACELAKRKTQLERQIGELALSKIDTNNRSGQIKQTKNKLSSGTENIQGPSLRRRLSNSGVATQNLIASWQAKKNRRRSSEGQTHVDEKTMKLLSPTLLPDVEAISDPNLPLETIMADPWKRNNESMEHLRRWHETNVPLLDESKSETEMRIKKKQQKKNDDIKISDGSSEEISSTDSEDLKLLKSRILAGPIMDEEDTYHPTGRLIPYLETDQSPILHNKVPILQTTSPSSVAIPDPVLPSNMTPRSILKRPKEELIVRNSFASSVSPEKTIRNIFSQRKDIEETNTAVKEKISDLQDMLESIKPATISESDTDSILSAAEAAKNRRTQLKSRSVTSEEEIAEIEAKAAVVNQYTEIVREYSSHSNMKGRDSATSSRRSSISDDQDQKYQEKLVQKWTKQNSTSEKKIKTENKVDKPINQISNSRRDNINSIPKNVISLKDMTTKEKPRSRSSSRNQSPVTRRRGLSKERKSTSRSSSKNRNRTPSRERGIPILSNEQDNHRSRSSSRSNSKEKFGVSMPVERKIEKLQKVLGNNKYRVTKTNSEITKEYVEDVPSVHINEEQLVLNANKTVRSTMSYIIDLTLLMVAIYVYFFKKEILSMPFIALLLYRRVQEGIHYWKPRRWH